MKLREELRISRVKAADLLEKYLTSNGWEATCKAPGAWWLWQKEVDGNVLLCDSGTAEKIQISLDAYSVSEED